MVVCVGLGAVGRGAGGGSTSREKGLATALRALQRDGGTRVDVRGAGATRPPANPPTHSCTSLHELPTIHLAHRTRPCRTPCCALPYAAVQANAPVLDALFADSVPTGSRSKLYTKLHM